MNTPVPSETLITPLSSKLFINLVISTISLLSQSLGLDSDGMVSKVILGILLHLSQYEVGIKFNESLAGEINSHLEKFYFNKHFRYQVYLFSIIVDSNWKKLEVMDPELFKD